MMKITDPINSRTIFCFWTADNPMSLQRQACLKRLLNMRGGHPILITPANLSDFLLKEHPLHPSYEFLSQTHKSDYLRTYFMHFYGGGYSDIKSPGGSWKKAFDQMLANPNILINGYRENRPEDIGYKPYDCFFDLLLGNCAYICRAQSEFTSIWYQEMLTFLEEKLELLKKYPATYPQDCKEKNRGYPIGWTEMLGKIFHKHLMKFLPNILYTVPRPICKNYR